MKDKIKQAGFKNQKELAEHLGVVRITICKWANKPQECPKLFSEYLDLRIENIALKNLLNGYLHPES